MKKKKKRGISFRISILCVVLGLLLGSVLIAISYSAFRKTYLSFYSQKAEEIVKIMTDMVDGDMIQTYLDGDIDNESYENLKFSFNSTKQDVSEIAYLYLFAPSEKEFTYVFDAYRDGEDMDNISVIGDVFEYGDTEYEYLVPDIKAGKASDQIIFGADVGFGSTVSAWAPVFDSTGKLTGMVECDYLIQNLDDAIRAYSAKIVIILCIGIVILLGAILLVMKYQVSVPLAGLTEFVDSYDGAEFGKEFEHKKDDEIKWLADSFVSMDTRIRKYVDKLTAVTAEKERIGTELGLATQIQTSALPSIFPTFTNVLEFEIDALMHPAKEVGGDFYDFFMIDKTHLALVIADVSGKGVPGALFMMISKTLLKSRLQLGESPKQAIENVNNILCDGNDAGMFVTVWAGIMDITTGHVVSINAGHEYPAIRKANGEFELMKSKHDLAVGLMEDMEYTEMEFDVEAGGTLFVYTDGVAEATNANEELFETERMLKSLNEDPKSTPKDLIARVKKSIDDFVLEAPQFDDITMLSVKRKEISE